MSHPRSSRSPDSNTAKCLKLASWAVGPFGNLTGCAPHDASGDRTDRVKQLYQVHPSRAQFHYIAVLCCKHSAAPPRGGRCEHHTGVVSGFTHILTSGTGAGSRQPGARQGSPSWPHECPETPYHSGHESPVLLCCRTRSCRVTGRWSTSRSSAPWTSGARPPLGPCRPNLCRRTAPPRTYVGAARCTRLRPTALAAVWLGAVLLTRQQSALLVSSCGSVFTRFTCKPLVHCHPLLPLVGPCLGPPRSLAPCTLLQTQVRETPGCDDTHTSRVAKLHGVACNTESACLIAV